MSMSVRWNVTLLTTQIVTNAVHDLMNDAIILKAVMSASVNLDFMMQVKNA